MKKIKFGMVGLGRLGIQHAENIAFKIPEAELTAICAIEEERVEEIKTCSTTTLFYYISIW